MKSKPIALSNNWYTPLAIIVYVCWLYLCTKGRRKKTVFLLSVKKGGGVSANQKKSLLENTQIFLTKGGRGSHPIQKGFIWEKDFLA